MEGGGRAEGGSVVELGRGQQGSDGCRSFAGHVAGLECLWMEGVGAMGEHLLSKGLGGSLGAEIPEHGVRSPAAQQHDFVRVDVGTEEGCGPTRTEGAAGYQVGDDACVVLNSLCSKPEGFGDHARGYFVPLLGDRVAVVVDGGSGLGATLA